MIEVCAVGGNGNTFPLRFYHNNATVDVDSGFLFVYDGDDEQVGVFARGGWLNWTAK